MKRILFLTTIFCLLSISAFAQQIVGTKDFSGEWELDVSKSKLDERARIESMTMLVVQTNNDIKIETNVKRSEASRDGNGMNRGGMMGGGNSNLTYMLNGKESKITQDSPMGAVPVTLKANLDGDKLKLNQTRTINTQMGEVSIVTKETWSLSADGKTLTVKREMETPRGTNSSEMIFTQKGNVSMISNSENTTGVSSKPRTISGGVVNGKARNLVAPRYPAEARAERASGQVVVSVTIDEEGNVISAKAISGHQLLRAASEEAALASKFAPTRLEGVPVKVTGNIVYNFVP